MNTEDDMLWFYVAADYKAVHVGTNRKRHLWARRVFVFRTTTDRAESKALEIAKENEHEYISATGDLVRWTFMGIESTSELLDKGITDGTEVYWDWFVHVDRPKKETATKPKANRQSKVRREPTKKS